MCFMLISHAGKVLCPIFYMIFKKKSAHFLYKLYKKKKKASLDSPL